MSHSIFEFIFPEPLVYFDRAMDWLKTEDYKKWAADKPPEFNTFAYLEMVAEREYANRLEF